MDKSLPLIVIDGRDPDLAKYNGPIRGRGAAYLYTGTRAQVAKKSTTTYQNEILLDREICQRVVGETSRSRPHPWFVFIPVVTRFYHLGFDDVQDNIEGLYRVFPRSMRIVEIEDLS